LFSDWTPANLEPHEEDVEVHSNCERVELVLNGKSLGTQARPADDAPRTWRVAFERGILKAIGRNQGRVVSTHELRTARKPARVVLAVDRTRISPAWDDVACVSATVVDRKGVPVPEASDLIAFRITGHGVIAAVDSADNRSHEPFQITERRAFQGRCFAWVKANAPRGKIVVRASAVGLKSASVTIKAVVPRTEQ
jgi:beta-galactosidase